MTETVVWQNSTGWSVSAASAGPVTIPLFTIPVTTPALGRYSFLYILIGSSTPGSQDLYSGNRGFDVAYVGDTSAGNTHTVKAGTYPLTNSFSSTGTQCVFTSRTYGPDVQWGGTFYLTVNLGTPTDSGGMPLAAAGAALAMIIDPGIDFPFGYEPRLAGLDGAGGFTVPQNKITSAGTVNAAVAPGISVPFFCSSVATDAAITFTDLTVPIENDQSFAANSVYLRWCTYISDQTNPFYSDQFNLPPISPRFHFSWDWTTATSKYAHDILVDLPLLLPPPSFNRYADAAWRIVVARRSGTSHSQIIG